MTNLYVRFVSRDDIAYMAHICATDSAHHKEQEEGVVIRTRAS